MDIVHIACKLYNARADCPNSGAQIWSIVVGLPLCAVGGVFYSWASGQTLVEGFVNAYGALYKIPGAPLFLTIPRLTTISAAIFKEADTLGVTMCREMAKAADLHVQWCSPQSCL